MQYSCKPGNFIQFGTQVREDTITFTFDGRGAKQAFILLYDNNRPYKSVATIPVPPEYRVGQVYSVTLEVTMPQKLCYLYQLDDEVVLDPYAARIYGREQWNDKKRYEEQYRIYGGFLTQSYEWSCSRREPLLESQLMIYKLHMRGFTMNHGLPKDKQGNVRGFLSKLDGLYKLGITVVEFMPLYEFEEMIYETRQVVGENKKVTCQVSESAKVNFWGYGDGAYFAPKASYFPGESCDIEVKKMVDAIHKKQMECIMEISFSNECSQEYMLQVLRYWVLEYHMDGFHLSGVNYPIEEIARDAYLSNTRIYGENMPLSVLEGSTNKHLFLYNDDFMYELRKNLNHKDGSLAQMMNQNRRQNERFGFVNYAANSTGFTLWDSFSYGEKHNQDNGEDNCDGCNYNCSYNYGVEGATRNREILNIRYQQMRNALAFLLLSQGIPMIHAGDEVANSQEGNNNPYCQDNAIGWTQFSRGKKQEELYAFVKNMIAFRKKYSFIHPTSPFKMTDYLHTGCPDISYHGREPWMLSLGEEKKMVGVLYAGAYGGKAQENVYIVYNFHYEDSQVALPRLEGKKVWCEIMNTAIHSEFTEQMTPLTDQGQQIIPGQSVTILVSQNSEEMLESI